jgi:acetate kinase
MKVLVINCGSSTLKLQVIEIEKDTIFGQERLLVSGIVERIGSSGEIRFTLKNGETLRETKAVADHTEATRKVLNWLKSSGPLEYEMIKAVGHRVIHGGHHFVEPTLINDEVIDVIESLSNLAPLHNEPSLMAMRAAREILGSTIPMVAVFDTAFHHKMPEQAYRYAIPYELSAKHHICRYGFHGIAHRYMTERYSTITSTPVEQVRIITLQLGSGCSAAAVKGGSPVDTSMGLTPLEGLMMGTRSGDVDPHLPRFLAQCEGVDVKEVEGWLNKKSGLLGVSGHSQDMRELIEVIKQGDSRAALAVDMFCYRIKKQIGAYMVALSGADAVVFGGGIGENSPEVRARICAGMEWCGLTIDEERNSSTTGSEGCISADNAKVYVYVIPVNEEVIIARDTDSVLSLK